MSSSGHGRPLSVSDDSCAGWRAQWHSVAVVFGEIDPPGLGGDGVLDIFPSFGTISALKADRHERERALARGRAGGEVRRLVARSAQTDVSVSDDQVTRLAVRAQAGDAAARERLIELFLPLISSYARRFPTEGLEETDLLQEGVVGVLRALDRYRSDLGVPFPAFATIRGGRKRLKPHACW